MKPRAQPEGGRGEATRARILEAALGLFRKHGLEKTTMREVAEAAGVALGAAYYYFPSKEALVLAYYAQTQAERATRARAAFGAATDARARVGALMRVTFEGLRRDRKLLGALFGPVASPTSALSVFGDAAREARELSVAIYREALAGEELPAEVRELAVWGLWTLQLGLTLYFLRDTSPQQERTFRLLDRALDLVFQLVPLAPMLGGFATEVREMLTEAGILPEAPADGPHDARHKR